MSNIKSRRQRNRNKKQIRVAQEQLRESLREESIQWGSRFGFQTYDDAFDSEHIPLAVGMSRVSSIGQDYLSHLKGIVEYARRRGTKVVSVKGEVCSGKSLDWEKRKVLHKQFALAKKLGVPLIIPCSSRWYRNQDYHSYKNPCQGLSKEDWKLLKKFATQYGVRVLFLISPDSTPPEEEEFLRRLNREFPRKGGRRVRRKGYFKARREKFQPLAIALREQGMTYEKVSKIISKKAQSRISATTVRIWTKNE